MAALYETDKEEVARIQKKTNDWEKTNKQLEKQFFTIDENIKYEMQKEGYRLEDLEKAEKLSVQTGKKAMELIRANIHQSVAQDNQARVHLVDQADNADAQPFTHMFISLHRHRVPRARRCRAFRDSNRPPSPTLQRN